ncbi:hypothetical protein AAW31_01780 [Nitrosomonas communis]|uniref:Uncharacterized protein n=1 Tax=Nitrosomonas communis TaxID=44574 RepID=A0A0F7KDI3_9PROT|nr:hypothetical protein AAW31_01780 [Nitrosomonas communis]
MDKIKRLTFFLVMQKLYRVYSQSFSINPKKELVIIVFCYIYRDKSNDLMDMMLVAITGQVNF